MYMYSVCDFCGTKWSGRNGTLVFSEVSLISVIYSNYTIYWL